MSLRLIVAITGSSGTVYGKRLLEVCNENNIETSFIISPAAEKILGIELNARVQDLSKMADHAYGYTELEAPISSGSFKTDGMVIVPCSINTLCSIASGVTNNLITRAADVTLKEGRKLILVPRETPLHYIHLKKMVDLSRAGATLLPAAPGFYQRPDSIEDLVDFIVGKILDQFDIDHGLYEPWKGTEE